MRLRVATTSVLFILVVLIVFGATAWAGTSGNIRGKVVDIQTNEPLPLVNILIVGSGRGTVTSDKGEYFVMGVQGGTYTVRASLLGYQPFEAKKVRIDPDETTVLDFRLASTLIEKEGMTIEGVKPLVDVKKTAGEQTYNSEKIDQLPDVKTAGDVLGLQAGVVKFGSQLFLRGGRANETQVVIDGVVVNNTGGVGATAGLSANEQLAQLYSGSAAGGALSVPANAIQSVSVSSSGLDAEYGNAQSGVVNITTKSGGEDYSSSLQYRTDGITNNSFNERYYAGSLGGPEPITSKLLPLLGAQIPGKMSFFANATFNQYDGPFPFTQDAFYHPLQRKVRFAGFLGKVLDGLGFNYDDKQTNEFAFNTKVSYFVGDNDQFAYSYRANASSQHPLIAFFSSINRYDSSLSTVTLTTSNILQWTHFLGTNSQIRAYISRQEDDITQSVGDLTPNIGPGYVNPKFYDPNNNGFRDLGSSQTWSHDNPVTWNAKVSLETKVHDYHTLKTGMEYYYEALNTTTIVYPQDPGRLDTLQYGQFPGYGRTRLTKNNTPSHGGLWVQDNIELTSLTIKLGMRYDFFYLGKQVFDPGYLDLYQLVTGITPNWTSRKSFWSQASHGWFSPRLAIGYPISERTVFYFNYSHFLQYPERYQYFDAPVYTTDAITVGNPALQPQKTVQYEAGFDQLLREDLSLGIRGFYKDVADYVSSLNPKSNVTQWVNLDYASTRGFEVILTKGGGGHYSGSIGYTFQLSKGRSSNPQFTLDHPELASLPREVRLDWDQEHTINLFVGYHVASTEEYDVLGFNLNNWGASLTWNYGSGFPYTPFNFGKQIQDFYLYNTGDGPSSSTVNISLYKGFQVMDKMNLLFTLDVTNLLNRRNVRTPNGAGFNSYTGRVTAFGDYDPSNSTRVLYPWYSFNSLVPPYVFSDPRQVSFGMKLNWN